MRTQAKLTLKREHIADRQRTSTAALERCAGGNGVRPALWMNVRCRVALASAYRIVAHTRVEWEFGAVLTYSKDKV